MLLGLGIGLALPGCAAEPPSTSDVEITSVGAPTPLTPPARLAASIRAPGLPAAAYRSAPAPSAINYSYYPSWTVDVW
jgi:hypothetical protein